METITISFKIVKNQNIYKPILASEYTVKGKSNSNQLRPESCPAIYKGSKKGILFFSEKEYRFEKNGNHTVYKYKTLNKIDNTIGYEIVTPALLGSNENEAGYFKIGNGLSIQLGECGAFILPPIDPRLRIKNLEYSIAYLPPFYTGQLVAGIRALDDLIIPEGAVIGQLILLCESNIDLVERNFEHSINFFEDRFNIIDKNPIITSRNEFYRN
jgi:hypothetical protein